MKKIILISCVSQKKNTKTKAKELYLSALFKKSLAYAENLNADAIYILSAKHGLLDLDKEIEPYNETFTYVQPVKRILKNGEEIKVLTSDERNKWGEKVINQLKKVADIQKDTFIVLAGQKYIEPIEKYIKNLQNPLEGKKIGERLQFLTENL